MSIRGNRISITRFVDRRSCHVPVDHHRAFAPIRRIGGETGWYCANFLWQIRGGLDRLVGGVGMKRGRRDPERLEIGDTVDCWRVADYREGELLRLMAEMKLPGRAWLQFEVTVNGDRSEIIQTAQFDSHGWLGRTYWYLVYPVHALIFRGMLHGIARAAELSSSSFDKSDLSV